MARKLVRYNAVLVPPIGLKEVLILSIRSADGSVAMAVDQRRLLPLTSEWMISSRVAEMEEAV